MCDVILVVLAWMSNQPEAVAIVIAGVLATVTVAHQIAASRRERRVEAKRQACFELMKPLAQQSVNLAFVSFGQPEKYPLPEGLGALLAINFVVSVEAVDALMKSGRLYMELLGNERLSASNSLDPSFAYTRSLAEFALIARRELDFDLAGEPRLRVLWDEHMAELGRLFRDFMTRLHEKTTAAQGVAASSPAADDPTSFMTRESFLLSWQRVVGALPNDDLYARLRAAYSDPSRRYHALGHVEWCLDLLRRFWEYAENPHRVAIALWFHDAIYDPKAGNNEQLSADAFALEAVHAGGHVDGEVIAMVLATKHDAVAQVGDRALVVDIDLGSFGFAPQVFDEHCRLIREEYAFVPDAEYNARRVAILNGFLARPKIFLTAPFQVGEQLARENIAREIARLSA